MCAIVWNSDDRAVLISTTDAAGNVNFWSQPQGKFDLACSAAGGRSAHRSGQVQYLQGTDDVVGQQ